MSDSPSMTIFKCFVNKNTDLVTNDKGLFRSMGQLSCDEWQMSNGKRRVFHVH